MTTTESKVLAAFHGNDTFPVEWSEGEQELFWVLDDLHCPNPISPPFVITRADLDELAEGLGAALGWLASELAAGAGRR